MQQAVDAVRSARILEQLEEGDLLSLAASLEYRRLPPGGVVFAEGGPPDAMFILTDGRVRIGRGAAGAEFERVLATLEPGESFGELGLLLDEPRSAGARTVTDATVYRLSREAFDRLVAAQDRAAVKLMRNIARGLCSKVRGLSLEIEALERRADAPARGELGALCEGFAD